MNQVEELAHKFARAENSYDYDRTGRPSPMHYEYARLAVKYFEQQNGPRWS